MTGVRRLWRRYVRLGVSAEMAPSDARCVILCNATAALGLVACAGTMVSVVVEGLRGVGLLLGACVVLASVPLLNRAGAGRAVGLLLCLGALAVTVAQAINLGPSSRVQYYLLPIGILPWFVFRARDTRAALAVSLLAMASFVAITGWYASRAPAAAPDYAEWVHVFTAGFVAVFVTTIGAYARALGSAAAAAIVRERERAEQILENVLPARVAARLRSGEPDLGERLAAVTVLYADIAGFTALAETMSPEALVRLLDEVVSCFDELCVRHGVEKIKTIGDAYVAAAGLDGVADGGEARVVALGFGMLAALAELRARGGQALDIRIGVASGPVVAGVIGKHKFSFEVWGEAVTVAERLEAEGTAGELHATAAVGEAVAGRWRCEPRAPLQVHGRALPVVRVLDPRGLA